MRLVLFGNLVVLTLKFLDLGLGALDFLPLDVVEGVNVVQYSFEFLKVLSFPLLDIGHLEVELLELSAHQRLFLVQGQVVLVLLDLLLDLGQLVFESTGLLFFAQHGNLSDVAKLAVEAFPEGRVLIGVQNLVELLSGLEKCYLIILFKKYRCILLLRVLLRVLALVWKNLEQMSVLERPLERVVEVNCYNNWKCSVACIMDFKRRLIHCDDGVRETLVDLELDLFDHEG